MKDLRVLIVEDEGPLASLLSQAFDNEGAEVSLASDGLDCMSKVADFKPHVIVMDIMMPRLDGIDTTRLIRRREGFGQVLIIALSARRDRDAREGMMAAGADLYMEKPFVMKQLIETVKERLLTHAERRDRP